jgi:hypothetical protein
MFCAIALREGEQFVGRQLPKLLAATIHEAACSIAQSKVLRVGKRACGYRNRIRQHVLRDSDFDDHDADWLCTTISAFLFLVERSIIAESEAASRRRQRFAHRRSWP